MAAIAAGATGGALGNVMSETIMARVRRRNPAPVHVASSDPRLAEISRRFHGTEREIVRLDPDQRRTPPRDVVLVGEELATVYRPHAHSGRGQDVWEHAAGDQGDGKPRRRGRRLIVADAQGRTYVVPGTSAMRFDAEQGLVG